MLMQLGVLSSKGLPVAGIDTARKLKGEPIPSNALIPTFTFCRLCLHVVADVAHPQHRSADLG